MSSQFLYQTPTEWNLVPEGSLLRKQVFRESNTGEYSPLVGLSEEWHSLLCKEGSRGVNPQLSVARRPLQSSLEAELTRATRHSGRRARHNADVNLVGSRH